MDVCVVCGVCVCVCGAVYKLSHDQLAHPRTYAKYSSDCTHSAAGWRNLRFGL